LGTEKLAELGLSAELAKSQVWWVDPSGKLSGADRAIGKALVACRGWRRLAGRVILAPPASWVAPALYRLVARYRYALPGGTPACRLG
jgi:predicted DCC family thiol-disulfide oxidoreductase YuxK